MGTTGQSITLANSIIGVGILAMPFCFQQCGVLLATIILLSMGLVSRLCCYFLLKSALIARRRNFEFLAFHVFGSAGKLAVEVGIIGFLMGTCIAYFVVVGDLGPQIIAKMFNINQSDILRTSIMVIVSLVCVLPLGLLRNVDSLSNVSAATIGFYFCLVLKVIAEAASQLLTSEWHTRMEMWKPSGFLQCVPIFSMALFCQAQLFEIFESLPSLSLEKMNVVTKNAINICTGVYFTLGIFGYVAFCSQNISGNILMSLSPTMANDVIKLGFVMSLAFSFPLIIFPCRASLYSFLYKKVHSSHHDHIINHSIPEGTFRIITVSIIAVALFISLLIPNIELVLGLVGSTIGVLICVVFPAACFVNVTFKNTNERVLAKAIVVLGLIIMVLGTYANLQAAERENNKVDRYDDKYITQERIDQIVEEYFQAKRLEKSEDVVIKPFADTDAISEDKIKVSDEIIKDSEVQPPNPVPPESQSNEKEKPVVNGVENENDKKLKEIPLKVVETKDNILESHPKNLKTKLKVTEISNGVDNAQEKKTEEKKEEKTKLPSNEDKIDMMKQQQLIETIKQHGKEQKELIKEQKEILHEIMKTKEELKQNKKEVDSREAKKIAVESIQKIANMAIQSLSGVSEKPGQAQNAEKQPLEKTANEAVQEIAKKAVETMEAIKEIKEKPKDQTVLKVNAQSNNIVNPVPVQDNQNIIENNQVNMQNSQPNAQNNQINPEYKQLNAQNDQLYVPNYPGNVQNQQNQPNLGEIVQNMNNLNPINIQPAQNMNSLPNELNQQGIPNNVAVSVNEQTGTNNVSNLNQEINSNVPIASNQQIIINNVSPNPSADNDRTVNVNQNSNVVQNTANNQAIPNENQQRLQNHPNENILKEHSHAPDEPQSYKQGEELQKKNNPEHSINNGINQKVPLPIAVNSNNGANNNNAQEHVNKAEKEPLKVSNEKVNQNLKNQAIGKNNIENGAVNDNSINNNLRQTANYVRQKREVVDCTEKTSLKPEDKQICETLLNIPKEPQDILPSKVDLSEVALRKLPIDTDIIHLRSLKSFKETNER